MSDSDGVTYITSSHRREPDTERSALIGINPSGMAIRHPPKPHELDSFITADSHLFQTMHMGAAMVNPTKWHLILDGLVKHPLSLDLKQLKSLPSTTVTTFHECYGSPLKPPTTPLWRIGNVKWTGVRLNYLLTLAQPDLDTAQYVWSEGLEHGSFAGITVDRFQKDLPMKKAMSDEVLLAYAMNGEPLTKERGFPVRLVVPGWFGTNSTKWICRLSVQDRRAPGLFTTKLYNEIDHSDPQAKRTRPVWMVEVNSMICRPVPGENISGKEMVVWGRAWGSEKIASVEVSIDGGENWMDAVVEEREEFEWQRWEVNVDLPGKGEKKFTIIARATDMNGAKQPLSGRRNCCHCVEVEAV